MYTVIVSIKRISVLIVGGILIFLGLLWFLQGSDIVHMQPILCFANCEPITGKSPTWQVVGAVVFIAGFVILSKNIKKKNQPFPKE